MQSYRTQLQALYSLIGAASSPAIPADTVGVRSTTLSKVSAAAHHVFPRLKELPATERDAVLDRCFLDLGGDSLTVAQFASYLRTNFGITIPLPLLLDSSKTLSAIAKLVDSDAPLELKQFDWRAEVESLWSKFKASVRDEYNVPLSFTDRPRVHRCLLVKPKPSLARPCC